MLIVATAALVQALLGSNYMHCYYIHKTSVYTHLNASVITFIPVQKIPLRVPARWQRHMHDICLYLWRTWEVNPPPPHKNSKSSWKSWTVAQWHYKAARQQLFCTHCNVYKCCIILQVTLLSDSQCSKRIAWHYAFDRICGVSAAAGLVSCHDPKPCNLDAQ